MLTRSSIWRCCVEFFFCFVSHAIYSTFKSNCELSLPIVMLVYKLKRCFSTKHKERCWTLHPNHQTLKSIHYGNYDTLNTGLKKKKKKNHSCLKGRLQIWVQTRMDQMWTLAHPNGMSLHFKVLLTFNIYIFIQCTISILFL